jgi:hypothetical protein
VQVPVLADGRVRIHYFHTDPGGPIHMPRQVLGVTPMGPMVTGATGFIACSPGATRAAPVVKGGMIYLGLGQHSDDPRAATCPECLASAAYKQAMAIYEPQKPAEGSQPAEGPQPAEEAQRPITSREEAREYLRREAEKGNTVAAMILKAYEPELAR